MKDKSAKCDNIKTAKISLDILKLKKWWN